MYTDDTNDLETLRPLALAELGLEGDGYQLKIDNNGDLLWINQHGSYTRKRYAEHQNSTAWAVLSYLAILVRTWMTAFCGNGTCPIPRTWPSRGRRIFGRSGTWGFCDDGTPIHPRRARHGDRRHG